MEEELGSNHGEDHISRHADSTDPTDSQAPGEGAMLSPTISESLMSSADWPQTGGDGSSTPADAGPLPEGLVAGLKDASNVKKRTRKAAPLGEVYCFDYHNGFQ